MERLPELEDLTRRFYQALAQGDANTIEQLVSQQEGFLSIGSDPAAWWDTLASFRHALRAQTQELAGVQVSPGELRAYREGTVGWAADRPTFRFPMVPRWLCAPLWSSTRKTVPGSSSRATPRWRRATRTLVGKPLTT
jgi:hypothetical protein